MSERFFPPYDKGDVPRHTRQHDTYDHGPGLAQTISFASDSTNLTNETPSANNTWEQWGTEEITFSDPGRQVDVLAWLAGYATNTTDSNNITRARIQISTDGGASWSSSRAVIANTGTSIGVRNALSPFGRAGATTPTGDVKVRAQVHTSSAANTTFSSGHLMALLIPA